MTNSKSLVVLAASLVIAVGASLGWWAWLGRPVNLPEVPNGRLQCLSYTPASDLGSPLTEVNGEFDVPPGLIENDMKILSHYTDCVRIYSSMGHQGEVIEAAAKAGIKVYVGIWISTLEERNKLEIDRALELANRHPEAVKAIIVGNEVLLRREMLGDRLADIIKSVKARTTLPVGYADIYEFWRRNPVVGQAVDLALVHILPYWDDPHPVSIDDVFEKVVHPVIAKAKEAIPGKPIVIGEIGWPSSGRTRSEAVPTLLNEARFVRTLAATADSLGVGYNLIEAIDQPWKRLPEGTVGGYWGILDAARHAKFPLVGPVREWRRWDACAAISIAAALAVLLIGWFKRRDLTVPRGLALGLVGSAIGTTGVMMTEQLLTAAAGWGGYVKVASWVLCHLAGSILLLGRTLNGREWPSRVPAAVADVARSAAHGGWAAVFSLGGINLIVLTVAAAAALMQGIDGRHRDFATLALWLPALAGLLAGPVKAATTRYAEEAWLAAVTAIFGLMAVDYYKDYEAWQFAVVCVALAAPWWPTITSEARRLVRVPVPAE